jgi:hypothetical protein
MYAQMTPFRNTNDFPVSLSNKEANTAAAACRKSRQLLAENHSFRE